MNFVIIGGDAAGMSAASRAKRHLPDLQVTVLEKTTDVSYSACGMPYNIADTQRDIDDLVVRSAEVFRDKQGIDLRTGHCAASIDADNRTVVGTTGTGGDFKLSYDKLLVATGASAIVPDLPGFDRPGVLALKSLAQGRAIKLFLQAHNVKNVVIIGMGYIAFEMCESLHHLGIGVDMVKPGPTLLPWLAPALAQVVKDGVESRGVDLHPGQAIGAIETAGDRLTVVCDDGQLACDMVLVAVGVTPNSKLAADAGIQLGPKGAIAVDRGMKTSDDHIFSAGDCADAYHVVTGGKTWIPLALRANRAGWAAADNVCGRNVTVGGVAGTAVFRIFDLEVAKTGLNMAESGRAGFDPGSVTIQTRSRAHAHPGAAAIHVHMVGDKRSGRLLGAQMVGREGCAHRINAAAVALHSQMTVEGFSQTDLAYAPPFGPTWDPLLTAANQLLKKL